MDNPYEHKIFDHILKASERKLPNVDLLVHCKTVENELNHIEKTVQQSLENISKEPFLAIFNIWVKKFGCYFEGLLEASEILLDHNFIRIYDDEGNVLTIDKAKGFNHNKILSEIRCERKWTIRRRESLVNTYISFISWLYRESRGYISPISDPDQLNTDKRMLKFGDFIEFLDAVPNEKSQLIAKLLYFGGKRTLEEILSLKLEQVNFPKKLVDYDTEPTHYPEHVFNDIKAITSPRKTGQIFEGRQTATVNPKTVFRNFQDAAARAQLEIPFYIKTLTTNR